MDTSSTLSLNGRVALITGSSRGLGKAMAIGMAQAGATVILNGRSESRLEVIVSEITEMNLKASYSAFDISDAGAVEKSIAHIEAEQGKLDILINNVGVRDRRELFDFENGAFDRLLKSNLVAPFELARIVARGMARRGWGRIINISSVAGPIAGGGDAIYTAAKGGLDALTRALAVELGKSGVTVNAIAPGWFATETNAELTQDPAIAEWLSQRTALGRWASPEELVGPAVFLASDGASYVTGHVLAVDGGMLVTM